MAEGVYRVIQLGQETVYGTAVAATTVLPVDAGSGEFTLDRGTAIPDQDFGTQVASLSQTGSHGVRMATASLASQARFEDLGHFLQMYGAAAVYTGAGPYTQTYTFGATTSTFKSYSVQSNNDVSGGDMLASGVVATSLDLGYGAIAAGENTAWTVSADLQANNLVKGSATGSLTFPSVLETIEGHLTTIATGSTSTAFGSLTAMSGHLVSYRFKSNQDKPLRPYGSAVDYATETGIRKRTGTVEIMLKYSTTTITDPWDIFTVAGGLPTERRVRIVATGSGAKTLTIDHRLLYTDVHLEPDGRDGEILVAVNATCTYDSTLASDTVVAIAGVANATLP